MQNLLIDPSSKARKSIYYHYILQENPFVADHKQKYVLTRKRKKNLLVSNTLSKNCMYRKVASSNLSCFVKHRGYYGLVMKGIFDVYLPWPFGKKVILYLKDTYNSAAVAINMTFAFFKNCNCNQNNQITWYVFKNIVKLLINFVNMYASNTFSLHSMQFRRNN